MSRPNMATLLLPLLLAGCAARGPVGDEPVSIDPAMSTQVPATESQQRAKVHTELGKLYLQQGRYEVALDEARIALSVEGGYAPAYNLAGLVYMNLRRNEQAEQNFRQALQLAGGDPEFNNDYGWFLCQTGRQRESIRYFRTAFGNPLYLEPVKALLNAGTCSIAIKEDRQAEEYLLRALRINKANPAAMYWLADIAYRGNRLADAQQRMRDLHVAIEPTAETAWLALRIDRKLQDREGEARYTGILRRKFRDSAEYQKLSRGEFD